MPKYQIFNNKTVLEPGSYTQVKGGERKAPEAVSTGKVLIIDTGIGAGYGGGSGSLGTAFQGKKSIYSFPTLEESRDWVRGGILWDIAGRIFNPSKDDQVRGCEELMIIQARESTPASITMRFGTDVSGTIANGGQVVIKLNAEGTGGNGTIVSSKLQKGFGAKIVVAGTNLFKIVFYVGTYKGLDPNGVPINNVTAEVAGNQAKILYETKPFSNVTAVVAELTKSGDFAELIGYLDMTAVTGTVVYGTGVHGGVSDSTATLEAFSGGTETYSTNALDEAIAVMQEVDNVYFLSDKFGITDGVGVENTKLLTAMTEEGVYEKFLIIGGGKDSTQRSQSNDSSASMAAYYNNPYVYVVHGDVLQKNPNTTGFRRLNTLYHAATIVGKLAGNAPQDPITWKDIDIDGIIDDMKISERNILLKAGVIHLRELASGDFVVNQEVNTLQENDDLIYPNGTSPEGSVMRIAAIINKEIKVKTEKRFVGSNYNLSDPADVQSYVNGILIEKTANKTTDNLIIGYKNIVVELRGTDYHIQYSFVVNSPINRLFITGFVFSPSSTNF